MFSDLEDYESTICIPIARVNYRIHRTEPSIAVEQLLANAIRRDLMLEPRGRWGRGRWIYRAHRHPSDTLVVVVGGFADDDDSDDDEHLLVLLSLAPPRRPRPRRY